MAFGTLAGWSLSLAGLFISGTVGFIMGRYVLDDVSAEKFRAKAKINSKKNLYNLNFYVRAIPGIPYWMQNIILGSVHTDFKMYTLSNMSVQGAIALAMNYLGASIGADNSAKYWAFGILIAVLVAVNRILAKYCIH